MSVISKVKLPDGNTYDLKDRAVLQSKTYENVIASGNSDPAAWFYFFKAVPTSSTVQCSIKYRVKALVAGVSNNAGYEESVVEAHLYGASSLWYRAENTQNNTSYRAYYSHIVYRAKAAGITSSYGHIFGLRLQSAYNPTTAANSRTITFEILETENCTVTFFDSPLLYANVPGTGSTNFDGRTEYNATTQGDTHTGDATNTALLTLNYTCYKAKAAMYRYVLLFTYDEQYLLPVNSVDNSTATTKTLTTQEFDPFGEIYYNASTNTVAADGNMGDWWSFCVHYSNLIDYRYSFNTGTTLTARKGIYLVCSPQSNGKVKLHTTPISQTLPTTEDGLLYIYLGRAYDTYRGTLSANKPIYYYKNGALRIWSNPETLPTLATVATSGSYNDLSNKPTIPTVTDTYSSTSSNAMSGKAVNAALQTLDSSISATTNEAISAITITDGKIASSSKITVPTVTDTYSSTSTNAMSGKAVNAALQTLDSSISATTGQAISAITITDGKIASSSKISVGDANQNAFSNVKVGNTTVAADTTTDTLELVGSGLVTITPDATNDKITISASYTETDPTVPSWAKASTKPTYTASEVGALPSTTVIPTVVDTYSSSGTDAVSGKGVAAALGTLDSSISATTGQAISAITITDGKITNSSKISVGDANQNAFSNVKVGSTTVAADTTTDTLELAAGSNITLTPDATNDKVTIAATVPSVVSTYSSTGTDAINGTGVAAALGTLDSSISATSGQAISAITITDGKIASSSKISVGETNQNAFSNVKVGSSTVAADSKTDTLELVAGTGITLTPDTTNDKITIASNSSGFGGVEMLGITIPSSGWSSGSYSTTVTSNAIATSDYLSVPQASTGSEYSAAGVVLSSAVPDVTNHQVTLTFTCTSTPTSNLDVVILVSTSEMNTNVDLAAAIANYPKIQNGVWYRWDVNNSAWVNTGVIAGITSIVQTTTSTADGGNNIITATLSNGSTSTFTIKNGTKGSTGSQGPKGDSAAFFFTNKAVAAGDWASDSTYSDYAYKATVTCSGVTANDQAEVTFSVADALSGNFAPVCNTKANGVEIWSKTATAITIPTIAVHPPASGSITTPSANWLDQAYPVGSVYASSTNTNPSNTLGGTWTLIDKDFSNLNINTDSFSNYFTPATGTTISYAGVYRSGHVIEIIRLTYTSTSAMADDTVTIGTLNFTALGMSEAPAYALQYASWTDGGNGFIMTQLTTGGSLQNVDVVTKTSGGSVAASSTIYVCNFRIVVPTTRMADASCDRFYWKRTA